MGQISMNNVVKIAQRRPVRWIATCFYRTENGVIDVDHGFEELSELEELVERGPDWHTIDRIEIRLRENSTPELTIEQSEKL